jgi:hypothetical protein
MPGAPSEPEKYSIDEMMDRLKGSSSENPENGERVIRADGSEAIRVRRRKRRSDQPMTESSTTGRRAKILQVSGALILLILAALAVATGVIFANSKPFRDGLLLKITQFTGATPDISSFRMNPKSAIASGLSLKWPAGNLTKSLELNDLNATISPISFLAKTMAGEEIVIGDAALVLQIPKAGEKPRVDSPKAKTPPIDFKRFRATRFDMTLGNAKAPALTIKKSEASFYPAPANSRIQFSLNQGDLAIDGWSAFRIDRAFMEFRENEIEILSLRLLDEVENRGSFELSGTLQPYSPELLSTLNIEMRNFPLAAIIGKPMGNLFTGKIDSYPSANSNYLSFFPTTTPKLKFAAACHSSYNSSVEVSGFPFLTALAQELDDKWFMNPIFTGQETLFNLMREAGGVSIEDIEFATKGRMALRGQVRIDAKGSLAGQLEVGIAESMLNTSRSEKAKAVFGPTRSGYRWLMLKIGGQVANPTDNFKEIMTAPPVEPAADSSLPESPRSTFDELTKPR